MLLEIFHLDETQLWTHGVVYGRQPLLSALRFIIYKVYSLIDELIINYKWYLSKLQYLTVPSNAVLTRFKTLWSNDKVDSGWNTIDEALVGCPKEIKI